MVKAYSTGVKVNNLWGPFVHFGSLIGLGQLLQNTSRNPSAFLQQFSHIVEEEAGVFSLSYFI